MPAGWNGIVTEVLAQGVEILRAFSECFAEHQQTARLNQFREDRKDLLLSSLIRQVDEGTLGDDHREVVFRLAGERQRTQVAADERDGSLAGLKFADHLPGAFHGEIGANPNAITA